MRGDGPADAGRPGRRAVAAVPRPVPDARRARRRPRRRGRPLRGRVSGTTDGHATCTAAPQAVVDEHDGRLPDSLDALLALPGVGPYTARAVLAFAFEHDHGDRRHQHRAGARPLGRASPPTATRRRRPPTRPCPPGQAWAWNQAMLDLGASVCRRRDPLCAAARSPPRVTGRRPAARRPTPPTAPRACRRSRRRFEGSDRQGRGRLVEALRQRRRPRPPTSPRPWAGPTTRTGRPGWRRRWSATASSATRRGTYRLALGPQARKSTISPFTSAGFSRWRKWPAPSTISSRDPSEVRKAAAPSADVHRHAAVGAAVQVQRRLRRSGRRPPPAPHRAPGRRPTPPSVAR